MEDPGGTEHAEDAEPGVPSPVRVLLVEDHAMVAEGLVAVLSGEPDIVVVASTTTVAATVTLLAEDDFDVVLADFRLPDGDGVQVVEAASRCPSSPPVVVLTAADGSEIVARAIAAGAAGFVHKSDSISEVVSAVRAVAAGEPWWRPELLAELVTRLHRPGPVLGADLTTREREVLDLLGQGASTQAMVDVLVLSPHTVRNHVRNVMSKLGAHSKLEAVTIAATAGLIRLDGPG